MSLDHTLLQLFQFCSSNEHPSMHIVNGKADNTRHCTLYQQKGCVAVSLKVASVSRLMGCLFCVTAGAASAAAAQPFATTSGYSLLRVYTLCSHDVRKLRPASAWTLQPALLFQGNDQGRNDSLERSEAYETCASNLSKDSSCHCSLP